MSWTSFTSFPPAIIRIAFLLAVVVPSLYLKQGLLPVAITFFWALTANGYAYSYMPTSEYLYALVMLGAYFTLKRKKQNIRIPEFRVWYYFFAVVLIVNFISNLEICNLSYTTLVVLLFPFFIKENDKSIIDKFSVAFMVLSIVISYYALSIKDSISMSQFLVQDRISWVDPNYMGMQIGMGSVIAIINLLKYKELDLAQKIISPVALIVSLPAILMTASRGSALCILGAIVIMMISTKTKWYYKVIVSIALLYVGIRLFKNNYFDVLLSRIEDDDGTGAGRTDIWLAKLDGFIQHPLYWIFGCGHEKGMWLGFKWMQGYHNDFIAILCMYGIVGFTFFIKMLLGPLKLLNKKSSERYEVYTCLFYLILALITLEPMQSGVIAFYSFLFYTLLKAKYSWYEKK